MSQQTFFRMLFTPDGHQWSKLESFLASSVLLKHFSRAVGEPYDPNNPTVGFLISLSLLICKLSFVLDSGSFRTE